jgi:hypothetical protein
MVHLHGVDVRLQGEAVEGRAVDLVDALVDRVVACLLHVGAGAVRREPITGEVLGGGEHPVVVREMPGRSLEPVDGGLHLLDQLRRLAERLVDATPAVVAGDTDARGEGPLRSGRTRLGGGDLLHLPHERRVTRGAEPDVVGEDGGAVHVPVAVDGVDAVDQRDLQRGGQGGSLVAVDHVGPGCRRVRRRHRASAGQHAAKPVVGDLVQVVRGVDRGALGLRHLADLLVQGHPAEEVGDALRDGQRRVLVGQDVGGGLRRAGGVGAGSGTGGLDEDEADGEDPRGTESDGRPPSRARERDHGALPRV